MNPLVEPEHCIFAHPWIDDDTDLGTVPLVFGASAGPFLRSVFARFAPSLGGLLVLAAVGRRCARSRNSEDRSRARVEQAPTRQTRQCARRAVDEEEDGASGGGGTLISLESPVVAAWGVVLAVVLFGLHLFDMGVADLVCALLIFVGMLLLLDRRRSGAVLVVTGYCACCVIVGCMVIDDTMPRLPSLSSAPASPPVMVSR